MATKKQTKVITRRKKFLPVEIPSINTKVELLGNNNEEIENKTLKLDLTRQLKGKSVEGTFKVILEKDKPTAIPIKIKLMPYFIRRMIRKRISYVEDSFEAPSQDSLIRIKPFLITRKRVSRVVRKTLRNKAKNWLEDYLAERTNQEIFEDILNNRLQKPLSLVLKKTYPLSLCEIRLIEIKRQLEENEIPEIKERKISLEPPRRKQKDEPIEEGLDQMAEIEQSRIQQAEQEIKETQEEAKSKAEEIEEKKELSLKDEIEEAKKNLKKPKEDEEEKKKETKSKAKKKKEE
jgi:ribosomal protein S3AE